MRMLKQIIFFLIIVSTAFTQKPEDEFKHQSISGGIGTEFIVLGVMYDHQVFPNVSSFITLGVFGNIKMEYGYIFGVRYHFRSGFDVTWFPRFTFGYGRKSGLTFGEKGFPVYFRKIYHQFVFGFGHKWLFGLKKNHGIRFDLNFSYSKDLENKISSIGHNNYLAFNRNIPFSFGYVYNF